jgi:hypothetical protein
MTAPAFLTKYGRLTRYAFSLGYTEGFSNGDYNRVTMFMQHECYHIKGFINGKYFWDVARTLKEARRQYAARKRQIKSF